MIDLRNWWQAQPWRGWRYRVIYRNLRRGSVNPRTGRVLAKPQNPARAAWNALWFPHHHDD